MLAAERAALDIHEDSPRLVKQTVVGYGNAKSVRFRRWFACFSRWPSVPQPQDAADALAVAICHFHHAGLLNASCL